MGRPCFSGNLLLLSTFLVMLLFSNGFGRKMVEISVSVNHEDQGHVVAASDQVKSSRVMMELDYVDAGPNVNGRSGYLFPTVSPSPPPPPPPPPRPPRMD